MHSPVERVGPKGPQQMREEMYTSVYPRTRLRASTGCNNQPQPGSGKLNHLYYPASSTFPFA